MQGTSRRLCGLSGSQAVACLLFGLTQLLVLTVASPLAAQTVTAVELATNDIVYDPVSRRIYASVPSSAGPGLGDTITTIDPVTAQIERSVFVGSEPRQLAISDDGKYLYVGLDGVGAIRRYEIATATAGLQIDLGLNRFGQPNVASDIEVLPGNPNAIAVARRSEDIVIFDDDVMRPERIAPDPETEPLALLSSRLEFADNADTLYGAAGSRVGDFALQVMAVTPTGVREVAAQEGLIGKDDIEYVAGSIFTRGGERLDPVSGTLLGTYAGSRFTPIEPDPASGQVYRLENGILTTFDLETFRLMRSVRIAQFPISALDLVRWDPAGLAAHTVNRIYLISELPPPNREPVCDFQLSDAFYLDGETIIASRLRLANPGDRPLVLETKFWFELPGQEPLSMNDLNPDGVVELPPGFDQDFGPVPLGDVTPDLARGTYQFNCRFIDRVTGEFVTLDTNAFEIR